MKKQFVQNRLLLVIATIMSSLAIVVFVLHRHFGFLEEQIIAAKGQAQSSGTLGPIIFLLAMMSLCNVCAIYACRRQKSQTFIRWSITLTLVMSSIAMIAAGDGLVEYHFSIFVVILFISMFQQINLIIGAASIFAVHHVGGFFFFPELLCGTQNYGFSLLMIHAVFLLLISIGAIQMIRYTTAAEAAHIAVEQQAQLQIDHVMAQIEQMSEEIKQQASSLDIQTADVSIASEQVQQGITRSSGNLAQTSETLTVVARNHDELELQLQHVEQLARDIAIEANGSAHSAHDGELALQNVLRQYDVLGETLTRLQEQVQQLSTASDQIATKVVAIEQVADQTKLLALNASIEAARAGEAGKGFSVVASEIQKLSEQAKSSTGSIEQLITTIHADVTDISTSMQSSLAEMKYGQQLMSETKQTFTQIVGATDMMDIRTTEIAAIIAQAVSAISQFNGVFQHVVKDNNVLHQEMEETTSAANMQLQAMQQVTHVTSELTRIAEVLQSLLQQQAALKHELVTVQQ